MLRPGMLPVLCPPERQRARHCTICHHLCCLALSSLLMSAWLPAGLDGETCAGSIWVVLPAELCHASPFFLFLPSPYKSKKNPKQTHRTTITTTKKGKSSTRVV